MKKAILTAVLGVLMVLFESSLIPAPWVLVFVWIIVEEWELKQMFLAAVLLGILVDVLAVRPLGVSALFLLIFLGGVWLIRRSFEGLNWLEWVWLLVMMLLWKTVVLGGFDWFTFALWLGLLVITKVKHQFGLVGEIRLR